MRAEMTIAEQVNEAEDTTRMISEPQTLWITFILQECGCGQSDEADECKPLTLKDIVPADRVTLALAWRQTWVSRSTYPKGDPSPL